MDIWQVVVVGAGPAGLLAAARRRARAPHAARGEEPQARREDPDFRRHALQSYPRHRCPRYRRCLRPAGSFPPLGLELPGAAQLVDLVEAEGVATKVEPGGKIFPASDRAIDVRDAFVRRLVRSSAELALDEPLLEIRRESTGFQLTTSRRTLVAEKLILATGGKSYPGCGTTGDGYAWAAALGHTVQTPRVALVPVTTAAAWIKQLQGITVADALVRVATPGQEGDGERPRGRRPRFLAERRGAVLFAHFGLSGPAVLDVSRAISQFPRGNRPELICDFLPERRAEDLDAALAQAAARSGRRTIAALAAGWLPQRLAESLVQQAGIGMERRGADLSRDDRQRLVGAIKRLAIAVTGTLGFEKAEVTAGGVSLAEVDSRTMESKVASGLFFAGELLDLDGPIGGYNFQAAFSTGYLAGESA